MARVKKIETLRVSPDHVAIKFARDDGKSATLQISNKQAERLADALIELEPPTPEQMQIQAIALPDERCIAIQIRTGSRSRGAMMLGADDAMSLSEALRSSAQALLSLPAPKVQ